MTVPSLLKAEDNNAHNKKHIAPIASSRRKRIS
nr:MAG TPA: hypothetical protein [Bacteriophage sp.]